MRPRRRDDFAIAIICALVFEADAVEALFDETYDRLGKHYGKGRGDANAYLNGRIGKHDVVLCYMPGKGKGSAAGVASSLLISYPGVRLALVVGICGGAPPPPKYQGIYLGDVIISDSVIEYDFGRQYPGGFKRKTAAKDTLGRPDREIRALLNGFRAEKTRSELENQAQHHLHFLQQAGTRWSHPGANDILFKTCYLHKHHSKAFADGCRTCFGIDSPDHICEEALGKDCNDLDCDKGHGIRGREASEPYPVSIYIGPVASADTVMKSGQHRDEIASTEKVLGFEREGAGVWDHVPCIIIKGVCDYADSHSHKVWQAYAAATGASVAKTFLEYWRPADHRDASENHHVMIPLARNPHFVGRQQEIQMIEDSITMSDGPRRLAITGLGGVGKTQIALEVAYRMRHRDPECSIFWIPCTSYETVDRAFVTMAQVLGLREGQPTEVKECLRAHLSQSNKKWILIFDNADDKDMWIEIQGSPTAPRLKNIIPQSDNGRVLFTSRNRQLALKLAPSNVVSIPDVDQKAGKEILRNLLIRKDLLRDDYVTNALLEMLSCLPLAISQAAAYINRNDISLAKYMSLLDEHEGASIELLSEEFDDDGRYETSQNAVATTWLISFVQIQQRDKIASDILSFMACISPREIPESILPRTNASCLASVLVQQVLTRQGKHEEAEAMHRRALSGSEKVLGPEHPQTLDSMANLASNFYDQRRFVEAEGLAVQVLGAQKRILGPEHPQTLDSMHHLVRTWRRLRRVSDASILLRECMDLCNELLGADHPDTVRSFNILLSWNTNSKPASTDAPTPPLAHTHESEIMPDSKPRGRKWRHPMSFLVRRRRRIVV
ncbi:Kinesin light chain [Penicillium ucsense]|uniref:Kinesin light chain n=1 Tax=Penicillium ucsense TaxID=2839758 RepID=A0A8J8VWT1_9EURO|nr:Kinesin light chain [Penicillium ucsense]KAF7729607.1 Kinesin light chain [Penicillium ucsense]